ncbi:FtsX-like permease family protein [Agilicoccus flavus]|uniref:FtsX-like permease family protein n=1 Tax=Agilicoccus flavus TaxID=2775968 RepID=UPI001CF63E14|nr:ABC transporter permease [Agilicoccus flavus]
MFVAWRDLRFARGRFALVAAVVALVTLLVGFLSGLSGGLAAQNVSAVLALPADRVVLAPPTGGGAATFGESVLTPAQTRVWRDAAGVTALHPLGLTQGRATHGDVSSAVAVLATDPGVDPDGPARDGRVTLSEDAATALGATAGATVRIAGRDLRVDAVTGPSWYSHTPVVRATLADWRALAPTPDAVTGLLVRGDTAADAADAAAGTASASPLGSLRFLPTFRSEIGSLALIVALLFGVSALVVGAFFTVWTMQRRGDVAVLAALGASRRALVRDALGQACVVLLGGVGLGLLVVVAAGAAAGTALPFVLSPATTLLPGALLVLLGLGGAAAAVRTVTTVDPLTALGSHR